jgi:hypothetical protein
MRTPWFGVLATTIACIAGCSQAQYEGELDDVEIPGYFSGAFASDNVNGDRLVIGLWSSLFDTCGLATEFLSGINEDVDDAETPLDFMADFAKERLASDWWLQVVEVRADDADDIDGAEIEDDAVTIFGVVCHFTAVIDVGDEEFESSCASISDEGDFKVAEFVDDARLVIESDVDLERTKDEDIDGDGFADEFSQVKAGEIKGRAEAGFCEGFSGVLGDFVDACDRGERGCPSSIIKMSSIISSREE